MLTKQCRWAHVSPNICRNQSRGTLLRGISLPISGNFQLLGAAYPSRAPRWYFTWPSGSTCHTAIQISFKLVQWIAPTCENADFWPLSKNNTRTGNCFYSCVCIEIYNSVICCHTNPSLMHKLWQHSLLTTEHAWHKVKQKCTTTFKHINFIWILEIIVGILPIKKCHISIQRPAKVYSSNTEQWLSTNVYYKIIIFPRNSCIFPQSVISVPHIRWEAQ